ncbi:MAG: hypothetical protein SFV55_14250 [Haliscomenobacter sp.]|uniref:hypothetical protein n=1 Tax=Haliscomenobacter sp. TaxID=2717303 RepID=UPI0029BD53FC|nr:hypothetical protein [Haliscomenobacter sp.]MDX2069586.1 hypothetical protein [Haliscomenobacter sp.]
MKKTSLILGFALLVAIPMFMALSPKAEKPAATEWRVVTVVESVVPGKLGRSKVLTMDSNGASSETEIQNIFSLTGINFANLQTNNRSVTDLLAKNSAEGFELVEVVPGNFGDNNSQGIFMTRFIFKK